MSPISNLGIDGFQRGFLHHVHQSVLHRDFLSLGRRLAAAPIAFNKRSRKLFNQIRAGFERANGHFLMVRGDGRPPGISEPSLSSAPIFEPPACDGGVVAAQEDLGDRAAAVDARSSVLGIFETSIRPERFVDRASFIPEHAGV